MRQDFNLLFVKAVMAKENVVRPVHQKTPLGNMCGQRFSCCYILLTMTGSKLSAGDSPKISE